MTAQQNEQNRVVQTETDDRYLYSNTGRPNTGNITSIQVSVRIHELTEPQNRSVKEILDYIAIKLVQHLV